MMTLLGSLSKGHKKNGPFYERFINALSMYFMVLRPWSFSASLAPVALGTALSWRETKQFSLVTLLFTIIMVVSVHAAVNFGQTYHEHLKTKVENQKVTFEGIVQVGALLYLLACLAFLAVNYASPAKIEHLAFLFFGGLSGSFMYTGSIRMKDHSLGDIIVITFVPVAVLLAYVAQCGNLHFKPLLYAIPLALNTEAILHSENARDLERDKGDGVVTAATILGPAGSYAFYLFLLFTPYIIFSVMFVKGSLCYFLPLITLRAAFDLEKSFRERNLRTIPSRTAKLNAYLAIIYVLVNF